MFENGSYAAGAGDVGSLDIKSPRMSRCIDAWAGVGGAVDGIM